MMSRKENEMLVGSVMTVKTFDVLDLVNMVAAQHEWDLWFDSGSGDDREVILAKQGKVTKEITVEFDFTGRIERSEYRRNGKWLGASRDDRLHDCRRSRCHAESVQAMTARPVHWWSRGTMLEVQSSTCRGPVAREPPLPNCGPYHVGQRLVRD